MTQQEKRIRIAEACGWKIERWAVPGYSAERLIAPDGKIINNHYAEPWRLPDYFNDLNAMHDAEKVLTPDQCWLMSRELDKQCGVSAGLGSGEITQHTWHATAAQRAEAFGLTLGLWTTND